MPDGTPRIDPDLIAGRIAALLREKRPGAVKPLLAALERLAPQHADLAPLRASYCCQLQDFPAALGVLDAAIADRPDDAALRMHRAEILFGQAEFAGAAAEAAEAVVMAPALTRAKAVLGLALLKLEKYEAALPCLAESFTADPRLVDVALALAALAPAQARQVLQAAIAATPDLPVLRNVLARRLLSEGAAAEARQVAEAAKAAGLADTETFCLLGFAQMQEMQWEAAGEAVERALALAPEHGWAARLQAALAYRPSGRLGPPLDAAAPAHPALAALLQEAGEGPVLDLYCGAGRNAGMQPARLGPWTGVDPDAAALQACLRTGLYARLEHCEPLQFLDHGVQFPIILLNGALGLVASPAPWLAALRSALQPGGFAFAEIPTGRAGLTGHGLFAHGEAALAQQAAQAGLSLQVRRAGTLRRIEGIPLAGIIACFRPE